MQATSGAFAAMVEDVDQRFAVAVTVDTGGLLPGDVTLAVESVTISASTTSDMPQGTRLQVGYPARSAEIVLSGMIDPTDEAKTAAWAFNPYSTDSPLYRQQINYRAVTVDVGLLPHNAGGVPELVRKFTGVVDDFTVDPAAGTVTFSCIDHRNLLRSVATIPAVVTAAPFNAGLTSEYAVDALLRAATKAAVSSWPAQRPACIFAAGLRSSLWPEVGTLNSVLTQPIPTFAPGPWGTGLVAAALQAGGATTCNWTTTAAPGTNINFECLVSGTPAGNVLVQLGTATGNEFFSISITNTGVNVVWQGPTFSDSYLFAVALGAGPHVVNVKLSMAAGSSTWSVTIRVDGATSASGARTAPDTRSSTAYSTVTVDLNGAVLAGVQFTTETTAATSYPFTPAAVLDPSLNPLTVVPEISGDPWQVIQQLADAELAVAGFDELGVFRFYNRRTLTSGPVVRTITSTASLKALQISSSAASVVNHAQVGYTPWVFDAAQAVYTADTPIQIPKGGKTFTVTLPSTATRVTGIGHVLPDGSTFPLATGSAPSDGGVWFRASTNKAGSAVVGGVTVTVTQLTSTTAQVVVTCAASACWLVTPATYTDQLAGTPALWIGGLPVTATDEITVEFQWPPVADGGAASSPAGDQPYQLTGNPWLQDDDTAAELAADIVSDMAVPRPDLSGVDIVPDPRLQLTDRVAIQDPDRSGVAEYAVIFGETLTLQNGSYAHSIDSRAVGSPGGWILGIVGRSELGVDTYV